MSKRVSLSKAARLAGIRRAELQERIRKGDLPAFDGTVLVEDLLLHYPQLQMEDESLLQRMEAIKAAAVSRDVAAQGLPDAQILMQRLSRVAGQWRRARELAQHYASVVEALEADLREMESSLDPVERRIAGDLRRRVQQVLHRKRGPRAVSGGDPEERVWMPQMAPEVQIEPGGHRFAVEGDDTVLEAALRAGISVPYGCSNGACGECRGRVLSGEVRAVRPADFVVSESERAAGVVLICAVAPVTDLVLETGVAVLPEQIEYQSTRATVRELQVIREQAVVLRVQTPRTRSLRFLAGQFVRVGIPSIAQSHYLALANCPCEARNLEFHLDCHREDAASEQFLAALSKGSAVEIEGPFGHFVCDPEEKSRFVFICFHTGFAPIKSLVEHLIAQDSAEAIDLLWITCGGAHYADNLCRSWKDALDDFHYCPLHAPARDGSGMQRVLLEGLSRVQARIASSMNPESAASYYIAGPLSFIARVEQLLQQQGVDSSFLHFQPIPPVYPDLAPNKKPSEIAVKGSSAGVQKRESPLKDSVPAAVHAVQVRKKPPPSQRIVGRPEITARDMESVRNPNAVNRDPDFPDAPGDWTRESAVHLARSQGIPFLSEEHWEVVRTLQHIYRTHEPSGRPRLRTVHKALAKQFADRGGGRHLYHLLPAGPIVLGCQLAGLEPPADAADPGFGHLS